MRLFTRTESETTKKTLAIYKQEIQTDLKSFWAGVILIPLSNLFSAVLMPLIVSYIIQVIVVNGSFNHVLLLLGIMAVVSILAIITNQIGFDVHFNHQERMVTRLLNRAMQALLDQSQRFFSAHKVGSLANDVNAFSRSYLLLTDTLMLHFAGLAVSYIASLIIVAIISPILLIPLAALTAFVVWHSIRSMIERSVHRNVRKELQSQLIGQIADVLGNQTLVRMFGKKREEIRSIDRNRTEIYHVANKEIALIQANARVRQTVLFSFQILVLFLIAWLYKRGDISIAAAVFAITYLVRIISTMFNITAIIRSVEQSFLDAAKVTEILSHTPDVRDNQNAEILNIQKGGILFRSVTFAYADTKHETVFENLSLDITPGTRVGLVGRSGGGKTTLTNLLLRYYDIDRGSILIDNNDISHVTQDSLRHAISYVPQDPYLFHRSLRENIAYGGDNPTDKEIIAASKKANALEFIEKLPHGLDTIVGERGVKLSGGQRQRIAIARAILKDAPILVLDEATSALDSESEGLIQKSLETLMKGRTSIVIAHRLSTIAKLDRIIVLDQGKIVEDGSHTELLKQDGIYASLWAHQSGGFIEE